MEAVTVKSEETPKPLVDYPISQDVKDVVYEAGKRAARQGIVDVVPDRFILYVLLLYNRMFSRFDALLKQSGVPPRKLKKAYLKYRGEYTTQPPVSSVFEKARMLAGAEEPGQVDKVEVEHLFLALFESPDPLVQRVFSETGLTREAFQKAIPQIREGSTLRIIQYCTKEFVEVVVTVLVMLIIIKQGLGEFRLIPSESMLPGLQVGDRVVVEKVSHWWRKPQRGDILVFYPPYPHSILKQDPWSVFLRLTGFSGLIYKKETGIDIAYIKRVVAVPGDVVDVRPGVGVFINGQLLQEPYIFEVNKVECTFQGSCGPVMVPKGHYYMLGDNRNHSMDSRFWGFLPEERIIGRAVYRFWPLGERFGLLQQPSYNLDDQSAKD